MNENERVEQVEHFAYLNELRRSGATNMFGARSYLMREFNMDNDTARRTLTAWMEQFKEEDL